MCKVLVLCLMILLTSCKKCDVVEADATISKEVQDKMKNGFTLTELRFESQENINEMFATCILSLEQRIEWLETRVCMLEGKCKPKSMPEEITVEDLL